MKYVEAKKVAWHLRIPICRTLAGIKAHIHYTSFDDLVLLLSIFNCDLDALPRRFYRAVKKGFSVI